MYYQSVDCGSRPKKNSKPAKLKAVKRSRVDHLVAEVETLMSRMESGQPALPQPYFATTFSGAPGNSSSSSSSSSSSESDSSDSETEHPTAAIDFERQQQELIARIAAGSSAQPAAPAPPGASVPPAAATAAFAASSVPSHAAPHMAPTTATNNVVSRGQWGALHAARVEVCMGKACSKRGAAQVLAELQRSGGVSVSGCTKCMGKCKAAPNVRVTPSGGQGRLYGGVSPAGVRSLVHNLAGAQAEYFP